MTIRAVFFDLDGTLLDTAPDLVQALNETLIDEGCRPLPFESARHTVSDGANAMLEFAFDIDRNSAGILPLREKMLRFYLQDIANHTQAFNGIDTLIHTLTQNEIAWGIVTKKPWQFTEPLMAYFKFASSPCCVICPDHVQHRKPHPEPLLLACQQANCLTSEAIYIGDHQRDIESGKNANMKTIGVRYGYISKNDDPKTWNADHLVDHADEIWSIIDIYR